MTDLKKLYQSELPSRAITVYLYLRGRANKKGPTTTAKIL